MEHESRLLPQDALGAAKDNLNAASVTGRLSLNANTNTATDASSAFDTKRRGSALYYQQHVNFVMLMALSEHNVLPTPFLSSWKLPVR